ncbi:GNAT family N-acetyltransferase [Rhodobacteraceae bacterium D3-12]|nr:GNAT family N-acetyltransferase [Rhodobacteraceae bacterium D3-12]
MNVREAELGDVEQISDLLQELTRLGKRTRPDDADFVRENYVLGPHNIRCSVAEDAGVVLGIQILSRAQAGNQWGIEPGWGIIGTHTRAAAVRRGVGRALFEASLDAAKSAGVEKIDASIGADNHEGLGYYAAMGFETYRSPQGRVCKVYDVAGGPKQAD